MKRPKTLTKTTSGRERACKTVTMCTSGLTTINRRLTQTRTVSWIINTLGLTGLVSDALGSRKKKEAETNTKIVDLLKHALDETKFCRDEQQRVEFHIDLVCVMTPRETEGSNCALVVDV
jgi:hypothetical protein